MKNWIQKSYVIHHTTTEGAGRTNPYDILFNDKKFGEGIADKEKYNDHPHKNNNKMGNYFYCSRCISDSGRHIRWSKEED